MCFFKEATFSSLSIRPSTKALHNLFSHCEQGNYLEDRSERGHWCKGSGLIFNKVSNFWSGFSFPLDWSCIFKLKTTRIDKCNIALFIIVTRWSYHNLFNRLTYLSLFQQTVKTIFIGSIFSSLNYDIQIGEKNGNSRKISFYNLFLFDIT